MTINCTQIDEMGDAQVSWSFAWGSRSQMIQSNKSALRKIAFSIHSANYGVSEIRGLNEDGLDLY